MTRRDWLTLFIAFEGAPRGLDPVRLQKGMFLFAQETEAPPDEKYEFGPYNYGPMSRDVYDDVDELVAAGLVKAVPVEGQSWCRYKPTREGVERGRALLRQAKRDAPAAARQLYDTKQAVANTSFNALLEDVYERYPAYAERSLFRRHA